MRASAEDTSSKDYQVWLFLDAAMPPPDVAISQATVIT